MKLLLYCTSNMVFVLVPVALISLLFTSVAALDSPRLEGGEFLFGAEGQQRAAAESFSADWHGPCASRKFLDGESTWQLSEQHTRGLSQVSLSHKEELPDITDGPQVLFTGSDECTKPYHGSIGPYLVDGQYLREDITDSQGGITLTLYIQFVDKKTCESIEGLYVDLWHANASGVYSGVKALDNAKGADLIGTNFHRGLSFTDANGMVKFVTKFPGHHQGRTHHAHVLASHRGYINSGNQTYSTDYIPLQTGQIFFDADLLEAVNSVEPYASNSANRTLNDVDYIYEVSTNRDFDPVLKYAYQGANISEGILGWLRIGVDLGFQPQDIRAAGTLGVLNNGGPRPLPTEAPAADPADSATLEASAQGDGVVETSSASAQHSWGVVHALGLSGNVVVLAAFLALLAA